MTDNLIYKHQVYIPFIQRIVAKCLDKIPGYTTSWNVSTHKTGTASVTRGNLVATDLEKPPKMHGIAYHHHCHHYHHTTLVSTHASPGSTHRSKRDRFFDTEFLYQFWHIPQRCVNGKDLNCVVSPLNCTRVNPALQTKNTDKHRLVLPNQVDFIYRGIWFQTNCTRKSYKSG